MLSHIITIVGYVICTLAVQGTSHFVVNKAHYAAIPLLRTEPIIPLGISSMLIQGLVLSFLFSRSNLAGQGLQGALTMAWAFGLVVVSYIALAEYGKYSIDGFANWVGVEAVAGVIQYTLIGLVLWFAYRGTNPTG